MRRLEDRLRRAPAALSIALAALFGCEPSPGIRIIQHVPDNGEALPPLAEKTPLVVAIAGGVYEDPYAWLEGGTPLGEAWAKEQLEFSRRVLARLPIRAKIAASVAKLGAAPFRITELRGTADAVFFVLPDGSGGATAPAHLMIAAPGAAPRAILAAEQPVSIRPSPDGSILAIGRANAGTTKSIVLFDQLRAVKLETIPAASAPSVVWARDGKSLYYVGDLGSGAPTVLRHLVHQAPDRDLPLFGAAAFGRGSVGKGDQIAISLGPKTISLELRRRPVLGRPAAAFFTTSLGALESTDPAWRDVTPASGVDVPLQHGDSMFILPGPSSKSLLRVDLTQAAPPEAFGPPGAAVTASAEAADGLYVVRDGRVARISLPDGAREEALDAPGGLRAVSLEANPFVGGARAFYTSCLGGGWYAYRPGDRGAHELKLDPRVADGSGFEARTATVPRGGGSIEMTILERRGAAAGTKRPAVLFPHGCATFSPELGPWLEAGGIAAFCDIGPIVGATTPSAIVEGRRRQSAELRACAHALVDGKTATPGALGLRASSEGGLVALAATVDEPELFAAVAIGQGVFDARRAAHRESLPEFQIQDDARAALEASVPYLHVDKRLPPFLLSISAGKIEDAANVASLKLAARLEAARPDGLAALVVRTEDDNGLRGPGGSAPIVADVDAFMWFTLTQDGAGAKPTVVRADRVYKNRKKSQLE